MAGPGPEPAHKSDLAELAEDIFGLNFRSLRTVRDLVLSPGRVFAAYARGDHHTYTPAVRIWQTLIGLQMILALVLGGYGEILYGTLSEVPREDLDSFFGTGDLGPEAFQAWLEAMTGRYGDWAALLHAPLVGAFSALNLFLLKTRTHPLGWVRRLNITFAILSTGSLFALLSQPLLAIEPGLGLPLMLVVATIYAITIIRGAPGVLVETRAQAIGRAIGYSVITLILAVIGAGLVTFIALCLALLG